MRLPPSAKFGRLLPVALVGCAILGVVLHDRFAPSAARKALPRSASEIQEFYEESGAFAQDYMRCLKARMPREDFAEFAQRLKLPKRYSKGQKIETTLGLDSPSGLVPAWFDAPRASDAEAVYFESSEKWVAVVKYQEPYAYFLVFDW